MTTGKAFNGKPYAGNPHVRFDEGEVASAEKPRRGSLLYEKTKMRLLIPAIVGIVFGVVAECHGAEASSTPSAVWVKPEESLQWKTVMSAGKPVALDWPTGAVSARLTVTADGAVVGSATISDTTATEASVLPSSLPGEYGSERILVVTVEYLDGGDSIISSDSARLGWVTGIGENVTRLIPAGSGNEWNTVEKYAVVSIPEDTVSLSVDSAAQTFDAPGWWEWRNIRPGNHTLALESDSGDFFAELRAPGLGFTIMVR